MRIHIEHNATSYSITFHSGDTQYDVESFASLDEALAYAEEEIDVRQQATFASIWDANTGEFYASCFADSEDNDYNDSLRYWDDDGCPIEEDYPEDIEMGFNPYLGGYDFDC